MLGISRRNLAADFLHFMALVMIMQCVASGLTRLNTLRLSFLSCSQSLNNALLNNLDRHLEFSSDVGITREEKISTIAVWSSKILFPASPVYMLRVHTIDPCRSRSILCYFFPPELFTHSVPTHTLSRKRSLIHSSATWLACLNAFFSKPNRASIYIFLHRTFPLLRFFSFGNGMRLSVFFFFCVFFVFCSKLFESLIIALSLQTAFFFFFISFFTPLKYQVKVS